ncbi:hypothetical protein [Pontibacter ruber]|uniref:Uncharacterized protein n=1 Tax=Pontibacter ruber TaxID=1343895 RepID=A0ABW5D3M3_9BACT|nr:hypothetical protein [Pontibacter ruber]
MIDIDLETKVIQRFIVSHKQERYWSFIKKDKTRDKFVKQLAHFSSQLKDFEEIKGNEWKVIEVALAHLGNPSDCYVISEDSAYDGRRMSIKEALKVIGNGMGSLLVFGDADQVYYEGEGPNDRWISKKKK